MCLVRGGSGPRGGAWSRECLVQGVPAPGGCLLPGDLVQGGLDPGGVWSGGCLVETPTMATAVGGTHPTGMHSCLPKVK